MFQQNDIVTVRKAGSEQNGHVGIVACTHETGFVRVYDFTSRSTKRWGNGDIVHGGTVPTAPAAPPPAPPATPPAQPPAGGTTPPQPAPPEASRLTLSLDCPADWPDRLDSALRAFNPAMVRLDLSRMTDATKTAQTWALVRRAGARVILLVDDGASPASILAAARAHLLPGDVIEFGNETGYVPAAQTLATGKAYGQRLKVLLDARDAAGVNFPVIAQGDPAARGTGFIDGLYSSLPNAHQRVEGFSLHPYGPPTATASMDGYRNRFAQAVKQLVSHGAPATVPLWVTEYGISTDNGVALDSNYGWPLAMSYDQAADALDASIDEFATTPIANVVVASIFQAVNQGGLGDTRIGRELWFGGLLRDGSPKGNLTVRLAALFHVFRGRGS